jgi:transposase
MFFLNRNRMRHVYLAFYDFSEKLREENFPRGPTKIKYREENYNFSSNFTSRSLKKPKSMRTLLSLSDVKNTSNVWVDEMRAENSRESESRTTAEDLSRITSGGKIYFN